MEPFLKPRPRMTGLDEGTLLQSARVNTLSQITVSVDRGSPSQDVAGSPLRWL